jgi:hypothetical protein
MAHTTQLVEKRKLPPWINKTLELEFDGACHLKRELDQANRFLQKHLMYGMPK